MIWVAFFGGFMAGAFMGVTIMCLISICHHADYPEDYPDPRKAQVDGQDT